MIDVLMSCHVILIKASCLSRMLTLQAVMYKVSLTKAKEMKLLQFVMLLVGASAALAASSRRPFRSLNAPKSEFSSKLASKVPQVNQKCVIDYSYLPRPKLAGVLWLHFTLTWTNIV